MNLGAEIRKAAPALQGQDPDIKMTDTTWPHISELYGIRAVTACHYQPCCEPFSDLHDAREPEMQALPTCARGHAIPLSLGQKTSCSETALMHPQGLLCLDLFFKHPWADTNRCSQPM